MTRPMSYPPSEMQDWFDHLIPKAFPDVSKPHRISRPITKFWETVLDLGVCGNQPINIVYNLVDGEVELVTISWYGFDVKTYLSEPLLMDLQSDIKESLE